MLRQRRCRGELALQRRQACLVLADQALRLRQVALRLALLAQQNVLARGEVRDPTQRLERGELYLRRAQRTAQPFRLRIDFQGLLIREQHLPPRQIQPLQCLQNHLRHTRIGMLETYADDRRRPVAQDRHMGFEQARGACHRITAMAEPAAPRIQCRRPQSFDHIPMQIARGQYPDLGAEHFVMIERGVHRRDISGLRPVAVFRPQQHQQIGIGTIFRLHGHGRRHEQKHDTGTHPDQPSPYPLERRAQFLTDNRAVRRLTFRRHRPNTYPRIQSLIMPASPSRHPHWARATI